MRLAPLIGVMRSNMSTPCRWSSSCWKSRASSSSASISTSLPSRSQPASRTSFGPDHLDVEVRDGQATLVVHPLPPALLDDRVDEGQRALADVVDEQLLLHADLRRGQAQPGSGVHDLEHLVGQADELAVDVGHLGGRGLEHGVAEHSDLAGHEAEDTGRTLGGRGPR